VHLEHLGTVEVQVLSLDGSTQAMLDDRTPGSPWIASPSMVPFMRQGECDYWPCLDILRVLMPSVVCCASSSRTWCPCAFTRWRWVPILVAMKHTQDGQGSEEGTKHISHPHCLDDLETLESMHVWEHLTLRRDGVAWGAQPRSPMGDGRSQGVGLSSRTLVELCCFYLIKRARM